MQPDISYFISIFNKSEGRDIKFSELVAEIDDTLALDMNLMIWDAEKSGKIKVDLKADTVDLLVEPEPSCNPDLADKIYRTVQHYVDGKTNVTRGRLNSQIKDPITGKGYKWHEYIMSIQYLIDTGKIVEEVITIPKLKKPKRAERKMVFLGLPGYDNAEWNARTVNELLANHQ